MAALVLVAIAQAAGALHGLTRRTVLAGLALGAIGYATQAGLYFLALERMDASVLSIILYTYPALVTVAAIVIGRERASRRRFAAVGIASAGTVLVLAGAGTGALDTLGTILAASAALAYSTYILVGHTLSGVRPLALSALVTTGATATFAVTAVALGGPHLGYEAAGWAWIGAMALISTVVAILAFFAGMERVGPSTASILATFEPVVTIGLAAAVFGEALTALQGVGAALVLGAVLVLAGPVRGRVRRIAPATAGS
jgi:drug/metabolite transporter (DMT)-like permease